MIAQQLVKARIGRTYHVIGNLRQHERGPILGLKASERFKKMVADAPLDSCLNFIVCTEKKVRP